jgi:hypothetical protein
MEEIGVGRMTMKNGKLVKEKFSKRHVFISFSSIETLKESLHNKKYRSTQMSCEARGVAFAFSPRSH